MTTIRDTWPSWAVTADEVLRRYEDPDPCRHDLPEPCICTHDRDDDHTRIDGGCAVKGCPCPWFDPDDYRPNYDEYEPEHYWTEAA